MVTPELLIRIATDPTVSVIELFVTTMDVVPTENVSIAAGFAGDGAIVTPNGPKFMTIAPSASARVTPLGPMIAVMPAG